MDFSQQEWQKRNFMFSFKFIVGSQELTVYIAFLYNFIGITEKSLVYLTIPGERHLLDGNIIVGHQLNFFKF